MFVSCPAKISSYETFGDYRSAIFPILHASLQIPKQQCQRTVGTVVYNNIRYSLQELAEVEGDTEKAEDLRLELEDLEDRAKELDYRRTSTISAIRSVYNVVW